MIHDLFTGAFNSSDDKAVVYYGADQWPRGLRHELSSPAQTLGSWVRIPLETWMSLCIYSVCAVPCAGSGLRRADPPSKESY
jgi:hypothetical protein